MFVAFERVFKTKDMEERYYYTKDGEKYGPFNLSELISQGIDEHTLIWYHGLNDWTPANEIEAIKIALEEASMPPIPVDDIDKSSSAEEAIPLGFADIPDGQDNKESDSSITETKQTADELEKDSTSENQTSNTNTQEVSDNDIIEDSSFLRRHIKGIITAAAIVILLLIMFFTCPSTNDHKIVISNLASDVAGEILEEETGSGLAGMGATLLLPNLTDKLFSQFFTVHNCGLFSYAEFDFAGEKKLVSVGVFGHVFTCNSKQVRKMMKESHLRR